MKNYIDEMPYDIQTNIMKMYYLHHVVRFIPTYTRRTNMNLKKKYHVKQLRVYTDILDARIRKMQIIQSMSFPNYSQFNELTRLRNVNEYWKTIGLRIGNDH